MRRHKLYLYEDGVPQRVYPVGCGGWRARTPRGRFGVERKIRDPTWNVPDVPERYGKLAGRSVLSGDPEHRLGPRWVQIHLIELFDRIEVGVPLVID